MKHVLYLDVFFMINFLMDLLAAFTAGKLLRKKTKLARIIFAAFFGALYASITVALKIVSIYYTIFVTYILTSSILTIILFGKGTIRQILQRICMLYASVFLINGIVSFCFRITTSFFIMIGLSILILGIILMELWKNKGRDREVVNVVLCYEKNKVSLKGLIDTGNSLKDPVTKNPVHVISARLGKELLNTYSVKNKGFTYIPYRSVGKSNGLMPAMYIDTMEIYFEEKIMIKHPLIGICKTDLSSNMHFQMIINPEVIRNEVN